MKKIIALFLGLLLILILPDYSSAQKLPSVQKMSVRVPQDVKIDGETREWNDLFQAYNKATDIFYTLSNDDNNLYLTVQATKPRIIEKIIAVGITFTVNNKGIKNDKAKENITVTFPLLNVKDGQRILSAAGVKTVNATIRKSGTLNDKAIIVKQPDSLIAQANKLLTVNSNLIKIKGINGISDTLSIYNEQHIRTAVAFDHNGAYIYELAIPLKYTGLSISDTQQFSYNIKLLSRLDDFKSCIYWNKWGPPSG